MKGKYRNPLKCIAHPFDQFYELRFHGGGNILYVAIILTAWFLLTVMERQNTGYLFNANKASDLNIILIFAKTVVLYFFWVAGNWTVSTFAGGIGRFKDILYTSAYAMIPWLVCIAVKITASNAFTLSEAGFLYYISLAGLLWSGGVMLIGLRQIHDLELLETFTQMILTVVCIAVMMFLCVLFYTLFQQLFIFFYTIAKEIMFRL